MAIKLWEREKKEYTQSRYIKQGDIFSFFYENQYFDGDLSAWDTSDLQDLSYAFYGCWRMDIDKLKHWNVSSVSDMTLAFGDGAGSLIQSPVPEWYH